AKLLIEETERATSQIAFEKKLNQLRLERNHAEAIRLLQARRAQVPSAFEIEIGTFFPAAAVKTLYLFHLAFAQRFVGDTAGAKVTAEQASNTLEPDAKEQPDNPDPEVQLALADAVLGERDSALREAERVIMLSPNSKDGLPKYAIMLSPGPAYEEILALIQTVLGENSRAISTLTRLLKTPYGSFIYAPSTCYTGLSQARSDLGSVARRSRFPKTLRGKTAACHAVAPFRRRRVKTRITRIVT